MVSRDGRHSVVENQNCSEEKQLEAALGVQ
jgi:hypothetical protein